MIPEGLACLGEVAGFEEVNQVYFELYVGLVEGVLDDSTPDGSIHTVNLFVGSGTVGFGQLVFDCSVIASGEVLLSQRLI